MEGQNVNELSIPSHGELSMGRGRGVLRLAAAMQSTPENPGVLGSKPFGSGREKGFDDLTNQTFSFAPGSSPVTLSPSHVFSPDGEAASAQLTDLLRSIGSEIGESIKMSLMQNAASESPTVSTPDHIKNSSQSFQGCTTVTDASKLNLVLHSDVDVPPYFRGDKSDKCSVFEWEDLMQAYLRQKSSTNAEQVEVVMNRLMGRARDITKVWMRSNAKATDVSVIFSILRQHFGDTVHSDLPLADFYATTPYTNEGPLDYWIWLNKAAEVAERCLGSKGESMTDLSSHLVLMFIRHCPDRELALVFKTKPSRDWTASEVQDHLDEYLRDHMVGRSRGNRKVAITELSHEKVAVNEQTVLPTSKCVPEQECSKAVLENTTMDRVLSLLETALVSNTQAINYRSNKQISRRSRECQVCGNLQHDTRSHCRMHRLCFRCFSPEHISVH